MRLQFSSVPVYLLLDLVILATEAPAQLHHRTLLVSLSLGYGVRTFAIRWDAESPTLANMRGQCEID